MIKLTKDDCIQALYGGLLLGGGGGGSMKMGLDAVEEAFRHTDAITMPVSYTHLDVYKRQAQA